VKQESKKSWGCGGGWQKKIFARTAVTMRHEKKKESSRIRRILLVDTNQLRGPDMIHNGVIYSNPVVPDGFYYMQVTAVQEEPANYIFPKLLITLKPHAQYKLDEQVEFASILHASPKCYWHYKNFFNTFMLGDPAEDLDKAIGQWGSVRVEQAQYGETLYSSVKFTYQPLPIRMQAAQLFCDETE